MDWTNLLYVLVLAYAQNISFSIVSRARNRDNFWYHLIAASGSNLIWFLTFRELVLADMNMMFFVPYGIGTVAGSLTGARASQSIERWLGASTDGHLQRAVEVPKKASGTIAEKDGWTLKGMTTGGWSMIGDVEIEQHEGETIIRIPR